MVTFSVDCGDEEIRQAVVAWSECLAKENYSEALRMLLHTSESFGFFWTPKKLADWISNYGTSRKDYDTGEYRKITSLFEQPNHAQFIEQAIEINRKSLYGLDSEHYIGMVHYDYVPLDGKPSDLTARFHIKLIGTNLITLEFLDIHVM
jgi:hypothetical protein